MKEEVKSLDDPPPPGVTECSSAHPCQACLEEGLTQASRLQKRLTASAAAIEPYRTPSDPYEDFLITRMEKLAEGLQQRLDYRDEQYRELELRVERRVENHFKAQAFMIILLMATGMAILRFWIGVGH